MGIEGAMRQTGGLHYFAHAYVLKSPFTEQAGSLLDNPFMLCGGLFDGIAHIFCILPSMTVIIFDAGPAKRRHYEAHRQEGSYYRR
jgi:hypothetical protein